MTTTDPAQYLGDIARFEHYGTLDGGGPAEAIGTPDGDWVRYSDALAAVQRALDAQRKDSLMLDFIERTQCDVGPHYEEPLSAGPGQEYRVTVRANGAMGEIVCMASADSVREALQAAMREAAPQQAAPARNLMHELQQKCSDWGVYWRAPDAHGVELTHDQALELLRDALGVEVDWKQTAPADLWKQAIDDELVSIESTADSYATPRKAVRALIDWHCAVQLDPDVSSAAQALIDRGRAEAAPAPICGQINSGTPCDLTRRGDERRCPDCNPRQSAPAGQAAEPAGAERIWTCKIGGRVSGLPNGADLPMRRAIYSAFQAVTGRESEFIFSGWGGELTEGERAVIEDRLPVEQAPAAETAEPINVQLLAALKALRLAREQNKYPSWEKGIPDFNGAEALADAAIAKAEAAEPNPCKLTECQGQPQCGTCKAMKA